MAKLVVGVNDLQTVNPSLAKEWNYDKNGEITPTMVTVSSGKKVWWKCDNGHEWQTTISNRTKGRRCPYCSNQKILVGYNDLSTTNPELAKEWDFEKNGFGPNEISAGSNKKVWWRCSKNHKWQASPNSRTRGNGCPICSGNQVLAGYNDLATTNPELIKEWDYDKNNINPNAISKGCNKKVWWKCKFGHSWEAAVNSRTNMESGCPYCSNRKAISGYNDLATTNPELIKEWDFVKNKLKPNEVSKGSGIKVWWLCPAGHSYKAIISNRCKPNPTNCPICSKELQTSFPEQAVYYYIKKNFPTAINGDKKTIGKELDIYIPELGVAVEYDGANWHQGNEEKELQKNNRCKENNIRLIRIREHGLSDYDGCICLFRENNDSNEDLSIIIDKLLKMIDVVKEDVNVDRDRFKIYDTYINTKRNKSLESRFPELAKEWNFNKNGNLLPSMFPPNSNKKVWWKCSKGHEWEAVVSSRAQGRKCPYCTNNKILVGYNDLATTHPELVKEWDFTKNKLKPSEVSKGSEKKIWWICSKGHSYQTSVMNRSSGTGCPYCGRESTSKSKCKKVINMDLGIVYESINEASFKNNINPSSISAACSGKQKTAGGYHWRLVEDNK